MPAYGSSFGRGGLNDQVDSDRLLSDIGLDRQEIEWRKDFVGFESEDAARLSRFEGVFEEHAEQVAAMFYDNLTQYDETTDVMGRSTKSVEELKQTQQAYLVTLASGEYGPEYFRNRARIGPPRHPRDADEPLHRPVRGLLRPPRAHHHRAHPGCGIWGDRGGESGSRR